MNVIEIEETSDSPKVVLNPEKDCFMIRGKSTLGHVDEFYNPILSWLDEFGKSREDDFSFIFDLDYFNIASSKRILFILYKLNAIKEERDIQVDIIWSYSFEDDDMLEVGEDFAFMVNLPFEFKGYRDANEREDNLEPVT